MQVDSIDSIVHNTTSGTIALFHKRPLEREKPFVLVDENKRSPKGDYDLSFIYKAWRIWARPSNIHIKIKESILGKSFTLEGEKKKIELGWKENANRMDFQIKNSSVENGHNRNRIAFLRTTISEGEEPFITLKPFEKSTNGDYNLNPIFTIFKLTDTGCNFTIEGDVIIENYGIDSLTMKTGKMKEGRAIWKPI